MDQTDTNEAEIDRKACGTYVRELARRRGVTIAALAEKTGLSVDVVNNFVYGRTAEPKLLNVAAVVRALDGSMDEMLGITRQAMPEQRHDGVNVHDAYLRGIEDGKSSSARHIESVEKDKHRLTVIGLILCAMLLAVTVWFIWDVTHPDRGLIRYLMQSMLTSKMRG